MSRKTTSIWESILRDPIGRGLAEALVLAVAALLDRVLRRNHPPSAIHHDDAGSSSSAARPSE